MRIALVGCGRMGRRRAGSLVGARLVCCVDKDVGRAEQLAKDHRECAAVSRWEMAISRADVDMVIVATPHDGLAEIARAAVVAGKHVLVEKPAARFSRTSRQPEAARSFSSRAAARPILCPASARTPHPRQR